MSHAYARNYQHLVFSTKGRRRFLKPAFRSEAYDALRNTCRDYGITILEIGGIEDHVHLLVNVPPKISVSNLIRALKANFSKWMNDHDHLFAWQIGYGAFSVSESNVAVVREYIRGQEEHHRTRTFDDEFMALLRRHGIEFTAAKVFG
jgi:putative transposase